MACRQCGVEEGSETQLCDACIAANLALRDKRRHNFRAEFGAPEVRFNSRSNNLMLASALLGGCALFFIYVALKNPLRYDSLSASLIFAALGFFSLASFITWGIFFTKMLMTDFMWAIGSLILPMLVYRYVALNWHEAKLWFLLHAAAAAGVICCVAALGAVINVNPLECLQMYQRFLEGHTISHGPMSPVSLPYE